jgi:hypothetical protein
MPIARRFRLRNLFKIAIVGRPTHPFRLVNVRYL